MQNSQARRTRAPRGCVPGAFARDHWTLLLHQCMQLHYAPHPHAAPQRCSGKWSTNEGLQATRVRKARMGSLPNDWDLALCTPQKEINTSWSYRRFSSWHRESWMSKGVSFPSESENSAWGNLTVVPVWGGAKCQVPCSSGSRF